VSLAGVPFASATAWRKLPAPEWAVPVTGYVAPDTSSAKIHPNNITPNNICRRKNRFT